MGCAHCKQVLHNPMQTKCGIRYELFTGRSSLYPLRLHRVAKIDLSSRFDLASLENFLVAFTYLEILLYWCTAFNVEAQNKKKGFTKDKIFCPTW